VRGVRVLALAAVAAGIALAGVTRGEPARAPLVRSGYTVLVGDFHVHGFPDGILPADAVREAARRRLDVIALTSHNSLRGWWLWTHMSWSAAESPVIVLPGEELTSAGYHLAIVGVSRIVPWRQPLASAAAAAHAQGAIAILAHPSRRELKRWFADGALWTVDGVEVAHPEDESSPDARQEFIDVFGHALSVKAGMAAIGSSDFHYFGPIGVNRTYLFVREATANGVLDAIRAGRTVACDARGHAFGPPDLVSMVEARCLEDTIAPPVGDTAASRIGTALAWAGLAALVLLGPSRL